MLKIETFTRLKIVGETFGARGCSSSCSCDPCDCNPCGCGSSHHAGPNYPRWRVSGYHITAGKIQGVDVSGFTFLSLAQPDQEGDNAHWQEILLVDSKATHAQTMALLARFEEQLEGMPAEVGAYVHVLRAVYQVPFLYSHQQSELSLSAHFVPAEATLIRQGTGHAPLRAWSYDGPMALRAMINVTP